MVIFLNCNSFVDTPGINELFLNHWNRGSGNPVASQTSVHDSFSCTISENGCVLMKTGSTISSKIVKPFAQCVWKSLGIYLVTKSNNTVNSAYILRRTTNILHSNTFRFTKIIINLCAYHEVSIKVTLHGFQLPAGMWSTVPQSLIGVQGLSIMPMKSLHQDDKIPAQTWQSEKTIFKIIKIKISNIYVIHQNNSK